MKMKDGGSNSLMENRLCDTWLPKKAVMRYFDYCDTVLRLVVKELNLVFS